MCGRGASPEIPRSKFTVVGLRHRLLHSSEFTCTKCVTELSSAADASTTKSEVVVSFLYCKRRKAGQSMAEPGNEG